MLIELNWLYNICGILVTWCVFGFFATLNLPQRFINFCEKNKVTAAILLFVLGPVTWVALIVASITVWLYDEK